MSSASGSDPREPFHLPGEGPAVLVVHGFTGSPADLRDVAGRFNGAGYEVSAPLLPGHGSQPEKMRGVTNRKYMAAVREAYNQLAAGGKPVALCGLSMGGVLSIMLAAEQPQNLAALVLYATPLQVSSAPMRAAAHSLRYTGPGRYLWYRKRTGPDIADPEKKRTTLAYDKAPLSSVSVLFAAMRRARKLAPKVSAPALVVHARQDHSVPMENAIILTELLGSERVELELLDHSYHVITRDADWEQVASRTIKFLGDVIAT